LALHPSELTQGIRERFRQGMRALAQQPDSVDPRPLLRLSGKRCDEQGERTRNEGSPVHLLDHIVRPRKHRGRDSEPSALAVFMWITGSNLVGCWTGGSASVAPLRMRST